MQFCATCEPWDFVEAKCPSLRVKGIDSTPLAVELRRPAELRRKAAAYTFESDRACIRTK